MTAIYSTATTLLVAIDISKHRHEALVGISDKKRRRRLTITNTLADFERPSLLLAGYNLRVQVFLTRYAVNVITFREGKKPKVGRSSTPGQL